MLGKAVLIVLSVAALAMMWLGARAMYTKQHWQKIRTDESLLSSIVIEASVTLLLFAYFFIGWPLLMPGYFRQRAQDHRSIA